MKQKTLRDAQGLPQRSEGTPRPKKMVADATAESGPTKHDFVRSEATSARVCAAAHTFLLYK